MRDQVQVDTVNFVGQNIYNLNSVVQFRTLFSNCCKGGKSGVHVIGNDRGKVIHVHVLTMPLNEGLQVNKLPTDTSVYMYMHMGMPSLGEHIHAHSRWHTYMYMYI